MTICFIGKAVSQTSQFDVGYILEAQYFTIGSGANDNILKFFLALQTAFILQCILESLVAAFAQ